MNYQDLFFALPGIMIGWYARKYYGRFASFYYSGKRLLKR